MKELEIAKNVILAYLEKSINFESMSAIYEISHGNNEELLGHIKALLSIFGKAKEYLEKNNA